MGLPRMTIRRWMIVVAVFATSMAPGQSLQDGLSMPVFRGFFCVIASMPMLAILIDFMLTLGSNE